MYRRRQHRITSWLALACYLTGITTAGLFHQHAELESCTGAGCGEVAVANGRCGHSHGAAGGSAVAHGHTHAVHAHRGTCPHDSAAKIKHPSQSISTASGAGCHHGCVACQLLSQLAVRTKPAVVEYCGEKVVAAMCPAPCAIAHVIADGHPARGPPAAA